MLKLWLPDLIFRLFYHNMMIDFICILILSIWNGGLWITIEDFCMNPTNILPQMGGNREIQTSKENTFTT